MTTDCKICMLFILRTAIIEDVQMNIRNVKPTIHGGDAVYWREEDRKSAFSAEQIKELSPLLNVKN